MENITYCHECNNCIPDKTSHTGYSCAVWGYLDFASPTVPEGFCHKASPKAVSEHHTSKSMDAGDIDVALHKFVRDGYIECDFSHPRYVEFRDSLVKMNIFYMEYLRLVLRSAVDDYTFIKVLKED